MTSLSAQIETRRAKVDLPPDMDSVYLGELVILFSAGELPDDELAGDKSVSSEHLPKHTEGPFLSESTAFDPPTSPVRADGATPPCPTMPTTNYGPGRNPVSPRRRSPPRLRTPRTASSAHHRRNHAPSRLYPSNSPSDRCMILVHFTESGSSAQLPMGRSSTASDLVCGCRLLWHLGVNSMLDMSYHGKSCPDYTNLRAFYLWGGFAIGSVWFTDSFVPSTPGLPP